MNMERNLRRRHHRCSITTHEQMCVSRNSEKFGADLILRTAIQFVNSMQRLIMPFYIYTCAWQIVVLVFFKIKH